MSAYRIRRITQWLHILWAGALLCGVFPIAVQGAAEAAPQPITATARLVTISKVPDPKTSIYSDCVMMNKATVIEGFETVPEDIIIACWGFQDRKPKGGASCKAGDYLALQLIPWEQVDPAIKRIQQADDLDDLDLKVYWAHSVAVLTGELREKAVKREQSLPARTLKTPATAPDHAPLPATTLPPGAEKARRLRAAAMQADKARIAAALQRNGGTWEEWAKRLEPFRADIRQQLQASTSEWKVLVHGKQMLGSPVNFRATGLGSQMFNLEEIIRFNTELRARGIDWVLLPVPIKSAFTSVFFSEKAPKDRIVAPNMYWLYQQLLEHDIEALDLLPAFHAAADDSPETPYIYNFNRDHHWSSGGRMAAARALAERLSRYDFTRQYPLDALAVQTVMSRRDEDAGSYLKGKAYPVFQVVRKEGGNLPPGRFTTDGAVVDSPILLAGDSMLGEQAAGMPGTSFADYLALATGVHLAYLHPGPPGFRVRFRETLTRNDQLKLLEGRRVFVWVFFLDIEYL